MSDHFTSILRVEQSGFESSEGESNFSFASDGKTVTLQLREPAPPTSLQQSFTFDAVYKTSDDSIVYRDSVRTIVESTLLGYNGTVISLDANGPREKCTAFRGAIGRGAEQIFLCLNKSKGSISAANLVVNCSFVAIANENAYDLLEGYSDTTSEASSFDPLSLTDDRPQTSLHGAKAASQVLGLLQYGRHKEDKLLEWLQQPQRAAHVSRLHHTILSLTVEYSHFGSMNAPISGTLSFVHLSSPHPMSHRDQYVVDGRVDQRAISLVTLAEVVNSLTSHHSNVSGDSLPISQAVVDEKLYSKSLLTLLLRDAVGGNCKTVFLCHVRDPFPTSCLPEVSAALQLVSRARHIHNKPNKRDLAERALMSAYMRQLRRQYETVGNQEREGEGGGSSDTPSGDKMEEERQRAMELAATALAQAVGGDEGEWRASDNDDTGKLASPSHSKTKKISVVNIQPRRASEHEEKSAVLGSVSGVTIDALVGVLQDPDRGVPRALETRLKDVKIRRDVGALFSGAGIVEWMLGNVEGVENERDAVTLGQLLLDEGAIFHSEGSMVFANADSLFYYAREARLGRRLLSPEEIQALLNHAREPDAANMTAVPVRQDDVFGGLGEQEGDREHHGEHENQEVGGTGDGQSLGFDNPTLEDKQLEHGSEVIQTSGGFDTYTTQAVDQWSPVDHSGTCGVVGEEQMGSQASVDSWIAANSDTMAAEEVQEVGEGGGEREKGEVTAGNPNTTPQQTLPSIQTLENSEDYPHPLHMAVAVGKHPGVIRHLVMMFGVDQTDEHGRTPLMFAALGNKRASCSTLIECGANRNMQDNSGLTALHVACYHGAKEACRVLLSKKVSISTADKMGHTALHWSTVPESTACLQLLLHYMWPAGLGQVDSSGLTALHWTIFYNRPHHLKLLLKKYSDGVEIDSSGRTLLTYAMERNPPATECINVLVEYCPYLLTQRDANGRLPLHVASIATSLVPLSLLVHRPPRSGPLDINCVDPSHRTPLHYAAAANRLENVQVLLSVGADRDAVDDKENTPLDYALLLQDGADMVTLLQTSPTGTNMTMRPSTVASSDVLQSQSTHSIASDEQLTGHLDDPSKVCTLL